MSATNELTSAQRDDLRTVAAMIVPASDEYKVPGADDPAIQADMLATLGRDTALVRAGARSSRASGRQAAGRTRYRQPRCDSERVPRHRRRRGGDARSRRAAMLLPRRPRAALARARAARAVPQGLHAGTGRLVAARSRQGTRGHAQAGAIAQVSIPHPEAPAKRASRRMQATDGCRMVRDALRAPHHEGFRKPWQPSPAPPADILRRQCPATI